LRTFNPQGSELKIIGVSYDHPEELSSGERNLWDDIADKIAANQVDLIVHCGGQVDNGKSFLSAWTVMRQYKLAVAAAKKLYGT
jgi:hypothetical protein